MITAIKDERIVVLQIKDIYVLKKETKDITIYTEKKQYHCQKRLYELEEILGKQFMRISKSTIINLHQINYVEPSFNGMMCIYLKNGYKDYISRKYLPNLKKYLDI